MHERTLRIACLDVKKNGIKEWKTTLDGAKTTLDTAKTTLDGDQSALRSDAIYAFYRAGILNGTDAQGTFNRTGTIKRSEVAAIIIRMMDPSFRVGAPADLAMVNK